MSLSVTGCDNGTTSTGGGTPAHTHTWGAWKSDAAKHWKECTANDGAKTGEGNHTGNPCTVCGDALEITQTFSYPAVTLPSATLNFQPVGLPAGITYTLNDENGPVTHTNGVVNGSTYGPYTQTTFTQTFHKDGKQIGQQVVKATTNSGASFLVLNDANDQPIQAIPPVTLKLPAEEITLTFQAVTLPSATLNFKPENLPTWITYTLNDDDGSVSHTDGVVNGSTYGVFFATTFTQTFYIGGQQIGQQIVKASTNGNANFGALQDVNEQAIQAIPPVTLKLR